MALVSSILETGTSIVLIMLLIIASRLSKISSFDPVVENIVFCESILVSNRLSVKENLSYSRSSWPKSK